MSVAVYLGIMETPAEFRCLVPADAYLANAPSRISGW